MRKRILDAGCGDGIYSRRLIDMGADHVIGVDGDEGFIKLARAKNEGYKDRIDYHLALIQDFKGMGDREVVIGSYVLSYSRSLDEAVGYCESIARCLRDGGKFIGFNNNPFEIFDGNKYAKYGFEKEMHGDSEGGKVFYRVSGVTDPITNFYLSPQTYEDAFRKAGFSRFNWHRVMLNPTNPQGKDYWKEFFEGEPPFIAMTAEK